MASVKVTVKFTGAADRFGVRIDDRVLQFNANGEASVQLDPGSHFFTFFVIGPPGTQCTISITVPGSPAWQKSFKIPANGVNGGFKKFEV
jgi:hypothetical protein